MARAPKAPASRDSVEQELPFEGGVQRLEEIVDRLEQGELELEEALAVFEEGVRLSRHCAAQLDGAERRVEILLRDGNEWVARPFAAEADDSKEDV